MKVLVSASERFAVTPDGQFWTGNAALGHSLWAEYLHVYDAVQLLARAQPVATPPAGWIQASGAGIEPLPLPYFIGPWQFAQQYWHVRRAVKAAITQAEAIQLRIPCTIGSEVLGLIPTDRPVGVEVVADPYDMFAPGAVQHPLRPVFRRLFTRQLRQECQRATAALYVTETALQQRYPCDRYSVGVSDVELDANAWVNAPRKFTASTEPIRLIMVGSLHQLYKAPDVLINAFAACVKQGLNVHLTMVGDGEYRASLEAQAQSHGVFDRIHFCGQLAHRQAVIDQLDQADLFILASRQEGLPKAMVEAMARGLPCIGSRVGGMPELLADEDLVIAGDVDGLARKIAAVVQSSTRLNQMSQRNLRRSHDFDFRQLQAKRQAFYRHIHQQTSQWLRQRYVPAI